MIVRFRLIMALLCLGVFITSSQNFAIAQSQDIDVRSTEQNDYSRLVFEWPSAFGYTARQDGKLIVVEFDKPASIDLNKVSYEVRSNVKSVRIDSNDPLSITVEMVGDTRYRTLKIKRKLIVDVFNPPAGKPIIEGRTADIKPYQYEFKPQVITQRSDASALGAAPVPPVSKDIDVIDDAELPEEQLLTPASRELSPKANVVAGVEKLLVQDTEEQEVEEVKEQEAEEQKAEEKQVEDQRNRDEEKQKKQAAALDKKIKSERAKRKPIAVDFKKFQQHSKSRHSVSGDNALSVSSTGVMNIAAFEKEDHLWIVADRNDLVIKPQISGPDADAVKPFRKVETQSGQAFQSRRLDDVFYNAKGSGLLWRLTLSPREFERKSGAPRYRNDDTVFYPLPHAAEILDITDPDTGETLKIVTVSDSKSFVEEARSYIEFDVLSSPLGLAIRPKVDDLTLEKVEGGIEISRPAGLSLLPEDVVALARADRDSAKGDAPPTNTLGQQPDQGALSDPEFSQVYRFNAWRMGGLDALNDNRATLLAKLNSFSEGQKVEKLIALGRGYLSNGYGAESLGFINFAQEILPQLDQNAEFLALRGAASAMEYKSEEALADLISSSLDEYDDINYWKAYVLADLGDWQQAGEVLPNKFSALKKYPQRLRDRLALVLAEVALRDGNLDKAERLIDIAEADSDVLNFPEKSALNYLKGEAARQSGDIQQTFEYWEGLINGQDDLHRTKAGLAWTRLQIDENRLDAGKAIDTLERLRYSWRGDELETQVNFWLGRTYFEGEQFIKGLTIMREAAALAPTPEYGRGITAEMQNVFIDFYVSNKLEGTSALDAIALYERFAELLPEGERGDKVVERLADHIAESNLLTRSANLLDSLIKSRYQGAEHNDDAINAGIKLITLSLRDDDPDRALRAVNDVEERLESLPDDRQKLRILDDIMLFRARALSDKGQSRQALELLERLDRKPEVNSLLADIAWRAGFWDDAVAALQEVILDENISFTRPLREDQVDLVLNMAVALNLANDRVGLTNFRERYTNLMNQSPKARLFDVVTRPRQNVGLADRQTLLSSVAEIELFQGFLESYQRDVESN